MRRTTGRVLSCLLIAASLPLAAAIAEGGQPDILWIITDDQRADSVQAFNRAVYGKDESPLGYVESPFIDKLAAEGVLFTNAYNQAPTCGPSRTSMLTGRYPFRNGKYGWENTHQTADFVRPTFTQVLDDAGYGTAIIGKRHYSITSAGPDENGDGGGIHNPVYDFEIDFVHDLERKGVGDLASTGAYGLIDSILYRRDATETVFYPDGRQVSYPISWADRELNAEELAQKQAIEEEFDLLRAYTRINTELILGGVNPQPAGETIDAKIVDEFQNYLKYANKRYKTLGGEKVHGADADKPLFINLGFHLPHTPVLPPASYRERFADKDYKLPEFGTDELAAMPPQLIEVYNEATTDNMTEEEQLQAVRDYYAFTSYGDTLIGEAVESFKAYAEKNGREYMIVLVIGDHGWHLGEQGIMGKFGPWAKSLRGAAVVVSSDKEKFPPGTVYDGFVEYVDFAPTILAAAGLDVESKELDFFDGYDLAKVVADEDYERDYILGEQNLVNGHRAYMRTDDFAFSMRTRDFRIEGQAPYLNQDVTWALDTEPKKADLALYDLRVDPDERYNLATTLQYGPLADWFRHKLGTIVLGDGRVEADWSLPNSYSLSNFAGGADTKRLDIPAELLPEPQIIRPGPNR